MSESRNVVPKFASFKPKTGERDEKNNDTSRRHNTESHARRDRRKRSSERSKDVERHTKHRSSGKEKPIGVSTNLLIEANEVFKIDQKGDPQNLQYGKLHRYSIPGYRRIGLGYVLGLDRTARIERVDSDELIVAKRHHPARDRPNYANQRWKDTRTLRLIQNEDSEVEPKAGLDFIPTRQTRKRRRMEPASAEVSADVPDYRNLETGAEANGPLDESDVEYLSNSSSDHPDVDTDEQTKNDNARLTKLTVEQPNDVNAWRRLIVHQEKMHFLGRRDKSGKLTTQDQRALRDVRSTIYEKAINSVAKKTDRVHLIESYMEEVTEIWESKRLADRWQELLKDYGSSTRLWLQYLDFVQANFADFRYERCGDAYVQCLEALAESSKQQLQPALKVSVYSSFIHVLTRFTSMVRDAGYCELAVAFWQAVLEFVIFAPQSLRPKPAEERQTAFEEFWESETPRIGESGAVGWSASHGNSGITSTGADMKASKPETSKDLFGMFAEAERRASASMRQPGRTSDELEENDPYHVILFSDVQKIILLLPAGIPALHLIQGYSCFAGLAPVAGGDDELSKMLSLDPFLQQIGSSLTRDADRPDLNINLSLRTRDTGDEHGRIENVMNAASHRYMASPHYIQTTGTLFKQSSNYAVSLGDPYWAQKTLGLLAGVLPEEACLAENYLALSYQLQKLDKGTTKADKLAKKLIKARPGSLRLYNAYGIVDARSGKSNPTSVFAATLTMSKSLADEAQHESILLWRTWVWEALQNGDARFAHQILNSIGRASLDLVSMAESAPSKESMLRASQTLSEIGAQALSTGRARHAVLADECLALLHYFQSSDTTSIEAAMAIFRQAEGKLRERHLDGSPAHECLHQARAELLCYHLANSRSYRPSVIRDAMQESVRLFPSNTIILSAFAAGEARFRLDDRVRSVTEFIISGRGENSRETIFSHAFAIATEVQRMHQHTGTKHAVRSAFERAVESKVGRHCSALWTAYLHFELDVAGGDMREAEEVFFKGLTKLPWCKSFMMEAFGEQLRTYMSEEQLMRVYNIMEEKELRVFTNLEELQDEFRVS